MQRPVIGDQNTLYYLQGTSAFHHSAVQQYSIIETTYRVHSRLRIAYLMIGSDNDPSNLEAKLLFRPVLWARGD